MLQSAAPSLQPPAVGQLVNVRNRRFVVTGAQASSTPTNGATRAATLVSLSSAEDDAHGEELQVVWELEPGAAVMERASMPELQGFDDPVRLDAHQLARQW